ncbi:hypothetical protein NDU88_007822 [Pleurodeles waltl]|uniref:Uncharacterized protein n=1 Tax=Pleurodeles waltl TaxID=8319 RepID=A0AAV7NUE5_PLEWA|nr:hypothetical protein NDU88_007822 [Pleurodeles waltl]
MLVRLQGRAPVRSARLLLSAARPGVRVSLFSRADPASSDLGLGPTGFGKDPHHPQVSVEDSGGIQDHFLRWWQQNLSQELNVHSASKEKKQADL